MPALYSINASPQTGRDPFLKMISILRNIRNPDSFIRIKFNGVFCPPRMKSVEQSFFPLFDEKEKTPPYFLEDEWLSLLDVNTWYGSVYIRSSRRSPHAISVKDILFSTGIIDETLNRITLILDDNQITTSLLSDLAEVGFNIVYSSYSEVPEGMPIEVPDEVFEFRNEWNNPYAFATIKTIVDYTKNPVWYNGPIPEGVIENKIMISRAAVGKAFNLFKVNGKDRYFGTDRTSSLLFSGVIDTFSFGHETPDLLSVSEKSTMDTHEANTIVNALDISCFADACEEIKYAVYLTKQMSQVNNIWLYRLAEYGLQPSFHVSDPPNRRNKTHLFEVLPAAAEALGIDSDIEAFYSGVPLEDICI